MKDIIEFQKQRIEALEKEIFRLNNDLIMVKATANVVKYSDPLFLKPLSEIETNFEIITPKK